MPTPSYTATCTKNEIIAEGIHDIRFTKPEGFSFEAGHFLLIDVPLLDNAQDIQPRAYSIASAPDDDEIVLAIKIVPNGRASNWIEQQLKPGMEVHIQGPFGKFLLDQDTDKEYVMMCTATGIAPFRSQLRTILPAGDTRKIDLFLGLLSSNELFWEDELKAFASDYPNFSYHICASEPVEGWDGFEGYVQEQAVSLISDFSKKQVYLCGSPLMTKAVKQTCITELGIPKEDIHMEGFI
jgi:ferredoxin-NADP reductase